MFKHLISVFVTFACFSSIAATDMNKGFKVETQFNYSKNGEKIASNSSFILAENNKTWNTLAEPKNGVALLGRIVKSDKATLQLEYIVVDTTKNNAVISTPAIIAKLGEKAEITVGTDTETVAISLLATATEYSTKK
jgi:type II secretory pathway component GspD/PulD (secretin)